MSVVAADNSAFFSQKENRHLAVLQKRLDHLTDPDRPRDQHDPAYPPGEAHALAWILNYMKAVEHPTELRIERIEHAVRQLQSRLGRVEQTLSEEDDEL